MKEEEIHLLIKQALKSDFESLEKVLKFLEKFGDNQLAKFGEYSLIFQFVFNIHPETGKLCQVCGGKCCKSGHPIPVYEFDYKELRARIPNISLQKYDDIYLLPRPCQFQNDWACSIHSFKPYACLSFPFATEDEQMEVIKNYNGEGVPNFKVPEYCIAGKKILEELQSLIKEFRQLYGRDPNPLELYNEVKKKYKKSS